MHSENEDVCSIFADANEHVQKYRLVNTCTINERQLCTGDLSSLSGMTIIVIILTVVVLFNLHWPKSCLLTSQKHCHTCEDHIDFQSLGTKEIMYFFFYHIHIVMYMCVWIKKMYFLSSFFLWIDIVNLRVHIEIWKGKQFSLICWFCAH